MSNLKILFISIALAMDAFSVSICKGLTLNYKFKRNSLLIGLSFSFFQMLMPLIGYFLGNTLSSKLVKFNHIIAFILLCVIGINMIIESYKKEDIKNGLSLKELFFLSIATSIDAMAIGITFSFFEINLLFAILNIGIICFILSLIGVYLGQYIGNKFNNYTSIFGGIVLILIGFKILLEHFFKYFSNFFLLFMI